MCSAGCPPHPEQQVSPEACHRLLRSGMQKLVAASPALAERPKPKARDSPFWDRHLICLQFSI